MLDALASMRGDDLGWPSEDRRTRMVFITRDLPRATIEETFAAFAEAD
jgi:G3E family GTPase